MKFKVYNIAKVHCANHYAQTIKDQLKRIIKNNYSAKIENDTNTLSVENLNHN